MCSSRSFSALVLHLQIAASVALSIIDGSEIYTSMEVLRPFQRKLLTHLPRATVTSTPVSSGSSPTFSLYTTVPISVSMSTFTFISNGQTETSAIPIAQTSASLTPPTPSESSIPTTSSPFPILPIVAGGGGLVVVILSVVVFVCFRRHRRALAASRKTTEAKLDVEIPPDAPNPSGGRTFSRLTFSAPYTFPQSPISPSTAAPSTVSIGQQYHTAPAGRR
ncbi:hypothetical protein DFH09DRAFT_1127090 [Mycena vulgaris]|nr:hypothetical protein DFH09DRAFT_1127090 [Mycena vulgaris]